jgi:methyl-accepting chemotaxis protein
VANEIRKLSIHSTDFGNKIRDHVYQAREALKGVESRINELASTARSDLTFSAIARTNNQEMIAKITDMNQKVLSIMGQVSGINEDIKRKVSSAVMALQFEDMVTQLLGKTEIRIEKMSQLLNQIKLIDQNGETERMTEGQDQSLRRIHRFKDLLSEASRSVEHHSKAVILQNDLNAGSIDLF